MILIVKMDRLTFFGESQNRNIVGNNGTNDRKLGDSSIKNDKVRSVPVRMMEATHHNVFHGDGVAELICLHQKFPILILGRLAVDKDDHSADSIFLVESSHVVTLDPLGRCS